LYSRGRNIAIPLPSRDCTLSEVGYSLNLELKVVDLHRALKFFILPFAIREDRDNVPKILHSPNKRIHIRAAVKGDMSHHFCR